MNKKEEIEELNKTLEIIFNKNLVYLQNNHPKLFAKLIEFEKTNPNDYSLDFENNQFELLYKNKKTYNCDPFHDALCRVKALEKNEATIALIDISKRKNLLHKNYILESNNFINEYIDKIAEYKNNEQINSNKFIFFGTLLGVHINDIHRSIKAKTYLIIEPSFEVFKLSMFLTDYTELANEAKIFFSINNTNLNKDVYNFLDYKPEDNHFIRFEIASEKELPLLEQVTATITQENKSIYPYSEYLLSLKRGFEYYFEDYNFIDTSKDLELLNSYPVLYLGAGPSLSKNEEFIKKHHNKFLIVAIAATLKKLQDLDIIPDIIVTTDSGADEAVIKQFEVEEKMYKNSIVIASIKTQKEIVELLNKNNLFFMNDSLELFANSGVNTGSTVGDTAYKLLAKLGVKEIYLLGFDAAIDSQTGATHDESYYQTKQEIKEFDIKNDEQISSSDYLTKVKGNFQEEVFTTLLYKQMIKDLGEINSKYKLNSFNLSNGAYINGSTPFKEEIKKDILQINKDELQSLFLSIKKEKLYTQDIKDIKLEKKVLKQLKNTKNINKLLSKYNNSISLQIVKRLIDLVSPYESYLNFYDDKLCIKDKQVSMLIDELDTIYKKITLTNS